MPLTPADVHNVAFSKPPIGKRGYNEDEVDAFLDLVEQELSRLIEENADLRQRVGELDQELADSKSSARQSPQPVQAPAPKAEQQRPVDPPKPQPVAQPAPVAPVAAAAAQGGDSNMQAAKILGLAQEMADRLTGNARSESEQLLGNAPERYAEPFRNRWRMWCVVLPERVLAAPERAACRSSTVRSSLPDGRVHAGSRRLLSRARRVRSRPVPQLRCFPRSEQLKTFEREYRVRLKSYLESQLEELENRSSALPVDNGQENFNQDNQTSGYSQSYAKGN